MPVRVLIAVLIVLFVCLLAAAADRAIKTAKRNRRRLDATRRLAAAAAQAEASRPDRPFTLAYRSARFSCSRRIFSLHRLKRLREHGDQPGDRACDQRQ